MSVESKDAAAPAAIPPGQLIIQIGCGCILSTALHVVARLAIADHLAAGPRSISDLAAAAGVAEDPLYRVLRALASVGIFHEDGNRRFGLTPPADLLRRDVPGSARAMALFLSDPFHFRVYAEMMHSVKTGQPAVEKVTGMPVFEYLAKDKEEAAVFNEAMTSFSAQVIPAVLDVYDFSGIGTLVDIAGGHGEVLMSILRKYPAMRGVLFDLDHVLTGALPRIKSAGLDDRCKTATGDFFKEVPSGGDAYLMKHIIHDWDDEKAATILKNIRRALEGKPDGKVILLESVIRPGNEPDFGKIIDLEMLAFPGGRERTADEYAALFKRTGFELSRIVPTQSPLSVIEARVR